MSGFSTESIDELLYTQKLADNDNVVRMKALKKLKMFLEVKSSHKGFSYEDFIKIWKGLYYCMYMADKPLVQEDLAEEVSWLLDHICSSSQKLLFFKVALDTFSREWNGIDKFRMDKFLMFFTRVLRQYLFFLSNIDWNENEVKQASEALEVSIICPFDETNAKPLGLKMHLVDIILEEIAKVGKETLPDKVLLTLLYPFFKVIAVSKQFAYVEAIQNRILYALIKQSDQGIENQDDLTLSELEIVKNGGKEQSKNEIDENEDEFVMDPRAGGVDVYLPQLKPDYRTIANALQSLGSNPEVSQKKRELLFYYVKQFLDLDQKFYPFKNPTVKAEKFNRKKLVDKAVKRLQKIDDRGEDVHLPKTRSRRLRKALLDKNEPKVTSAIEKQKRRNVTTFKENVKKEKLIRSKSMTKGKTIQKRTRQRKKITRKNRESFKCKRNTPKNIKTMK